MYVTCTITDKSQQDLPEERKDNRGMQTDVQKAPESDTSMEFTRIVQKCQNHCQVSSGIKRKEV